ncbi:MAG: hypothetical protein NC117_10055 [Pseudoflavonifractor sp.]|nr:hypothetical protein [Pseudoflavonifractor sp.]
MARLTSIPLDEPIATSDPYNVLGRKRAGEGYDVATPIRYAGDGNGDAINIWAKYKPMVPLTDHPQPLTDAERAAVNYGLSLYVDGVKYVTHTGYNSVNTPVMIPKCEWRYDGRPGAGDCYRLSDWRGYVHVSAPPISPVGDFVLYTSDNLTVRANVTGIQATNNLTIADFPYVKDLYFCVLVYRKHKTTGAINVLGWLTPSTTIGNGGTTVTIQRSNLVATDASQYGTLEYVLCGATAAQATNFKGNTNCSFLALPCESPLTGTITLTDASTFRLTPYGICPASDMSTVYDINRFRPVSNGTNTYFGLGAGVWVLCECQGGTTSSHITSATLQMQVRQTLATSGWMLNPVNISPAGIYTLMSQYGTPTKVTDFYIPANGTLYIALDISNMVTMAADGSTSSILAPYGAFFANLGYLAGTTLSDFNGLATLNINIHPATGLKEAEANGDGELADPTV